MLDQIRKLSNLVNNFSNYKSRLIISLYSTLFVLGLFIVPSYGIAWDEYGGRAHGTYNLVYVVKTLLPNLVPKPYLNFPTLDQWYAHTHGAWYDMLISIFEVIFKLEANKPIYLMRHYVNYTFCFIGLLSLYSLMNRIFKNRFAGIIATIFAILSPRQFADTFYNNKDTIFLSASVITFNFLSFYIANKSRKSLVVLAISCGLLAGIRLNGLLIIPIVFAIIVLLNHKIFNFKSLSNLILFNIISIITFFFSMPYLWTNPIVKLISILKANENFDWNGKVLFDGQLLYGADLPWYYILVWIGISTPILYIALIIMNFPLKILTGKRKVITINENYHRPIIEVSLLVFLIVPFLIAISSHSTLYNGWRHFYFLQFGIIYFSTSTVLMLWELFNKKWKVKVFICILLVLNEFFIAGWMFYNKPMQNLYFNYFAGERISARWDMDYWGVGNLEVLKFILETDHKRIISVASLSSTPLDLSLKLLNENEVSRLNILNRVSFTNSKKTLDFGEEKPMYLINNFNELRPTKEILHIVGYSILSRFIVSNNTYLILYKLNL